MNGCGIVPDGAVKPRKHMPTRRGIMARTFPTAELQTACGGLSGYAAADSRKVTTAPALAPMCLSCDIL